MDAEPVVSFARSAAVVCLVGDPTDLGPEVDGVSVERVIGRRLDYDTESFDDVAEARRAVIRTVTRIADAGPALLFPFFSYVTARELGLAHPDITYIGNPPEIERLLDFKPWVETQLSAIGIPVLPWRHLWARDLAAVRTSTPMVLRPPRGTGGQGMSIISTAEAAAARLASTDPDCLVSVAPYVRAGASLNVTACVRADRSVSLHPPSLQLIGVPECTRYTFGYCGNDFGAVDLVDPALLDQVGELTVATGRWMAGYGFLGAFGLDLLIDEDDTLVVTELNPRFQGSSHLGSLVMREAGRPDVYAEHLEAHLGITPSTPPTSMADVAALRRDVVQVICYSDPGSLAARQVDDAAVREAGLSGFDIEMPPPVGAPVDDHALLFRLVGRRRAFGCDGSVEGDVRALTAALRDSIVSPEATDAP